MKGSTLVAAAAVIALMAAIIWGTSAASRAARRTLRPTAPPCAPRTPPPSASRDDGAMFAKPSAQARIDKFLRGSMYRPFDDVSLSRARLVRNSGGQRTYSMLACTGNALDHVGVVFVNGRMVARFSTVRVSFATPSGASCFDAEKLHALQDVLFLCAAGAPGRTAFDARAEFGDGQIVKVSVPLQDGGADMASRVVQVDMGTGVKTLDYIERESDLLRPSDKPPAPPGTIESEGWQRGGTAAGVDPSLGWDAASLTGRAATASPTAPWPGSAGQHWYGAPDPTVPSHDFKF